MSTVERASMSKDSAGSKPLVKLIAFSAPVRGGDPRRLAILAIKVSQGRLHEKSYEHYLTAYSNERVSEWLRISYAFPSVLEHIVFTFLIEDISRVCSHQLVRHRIASYTQESQRYSESYARRALRKIESLLKERGVAIDKRSRARVIEQFLEIASPVEIVEAASEAFVIPKHLGKELASEIARSYLQALAEYYRLVDSGAKPEDARFILPQAIKTRILMTVNLRELLHIACLRLSTKAQWEIREVVKKMIEEVERVVPEVKQMLRAMCREEVEL